MFAACFRLNDAATITATVRAACQPRVSLLPHAPGCMAALPQENKYAGVDLIYIFIYFK